MATVRHPLLRDGVEARPYQLRSLEQILTASSLMVMPTGFGKTAVQWMAMAEFLHQGPDKIVLIAPTTGLVDQHVRMARQFLAVEPTDVVTYTGGTPPAKREQLWNQGRIFMATPQVVRNDAMNGTLKLSEVSLLIVDEAHHATGNHAYAQVGRLYRQQRNDGRILGATASPGSNLKNIKQVKTNLDTLSVDLSKRDEHLLRPYDVDMVIHQHRLPLPELLKTLGAPVQEHYNNEVAHLQRLGFLAPKEHIASGDIERAQLRASSAIQQRDVRGYDAARRVGDLRRLHMVLNLLKSQGTNVVRAFLDRAEEEGRDGRKTNRLLALQSIHDLRLALNDSEELHPKLAQVEQLVEDELGQKPNGKVLVFTEFRDTVTHLVEVLNRHDSVRADAFIGQSSRGQQKGMTQKQQLAQLQRFREGEINTLVATSVGEEGLDVPAADLVVLYEPVPSAVRAIQRRGRTARQRAGSVHVLIAEESRDVYVQRASEHQEANMHRLLASMVKRNLFQINHPSARALDSFSVIEDGVEEAAKAFLDRAVAEAVASAPPPAASPSTLPLRKPKVTAAPMTPQQRRPSSQMGLEAYSNQPSQTLLPDMQLIQPVLNATNAVMDTLNEAAGEGQEVWVDHREGNSTLPALLMSLGLKVKLTHLPLGDVRLSSRVLIERKSARDLLASIKNGRLLHQCRGLKAHALRPLLLIEHGSGGHGLHPNAVLGALAHVSLDLGLPVMITKGPEESAHFIAVASRREHRMMQRWMELVERGRPDDQQADALSKAAQHELEHLEANPEDHPWQQEGIEQLHRWFMMCVEEHEQLNDAERNGLLGTSPHLVALLASTADHIQAQLGCSSQRAADLVRSWHGVTSR